MSDGSNPGGHLPPPAATGGGFAPPEVGGLAGGFAAPEVGGVAGNLAAPGVGGTAGQVSGQVPGDVMGNSIGEATASGPGTSMGEAVGGHGSSMGEAVADSARRSGDLGQRAGAARTHDLAQQTSRVGRLRHLRPRAQMGIIAGAAASAAIVAGGIVLATRDEPSTERRAAVETSVVTSLTAAEAAPNTAAATVTPVTAAPSTAAATTAAPTTVAETTTTSEPTTTVVALPSGAGSYAVAGGEIVVSGALVNGVVGSAGSQTWVLAGACDGVGECTITVEGEAVVSTAGATPLPAGGTISLAPAGPGAYLVTTSIAVAECGDGVGTMTIALVDGTLTGLWSVTYSGGADCPFTTLSASYTGTRT